jgi:hypothetical protein
MKHLFPYNLWDTPHPEVTGVEITPVSCSSFHTARPNVTHALLILWPCVMLVVVFYRLVGGALVQSQDILTARDKYSTVTKERLILTSSDDDRIVRLPVFGSRMSDQNVAFTSSLDCLYVTTLAELSTC